MQLKQYCVTLRICNALLVGLTVDICTLCVQGLREEAAKKEKRFQDKLQNEKQATERYQQKQRHKEIT